MWYDRFRHLRKIKTITCQIHQLHKSCFFSIYFTANSWTLHIDRWIESYKVLPFLSFKACQFQQIIIFASINSLSEYLELL